MERLEKEQETKLSLSKNETPRKRIQGGQDPIRGQSTPIEREYECITSGKHRTPTLDSTQTMAAAVNVQNLDPVARTT